MRLLGLLVIVLSFAGCPGGREVHEQQGLEQYLEFEGFTVERGLYKPKPGWSFLPQDDGSFEVARADDSGGTIDPCECTIETPIPGEFQSGECLQQTDLDDEDNITGIWCLDDGCGFCVGGTTTDPDEPSSLVRFRLECVDEQRVGL